MCIFYVCIHVCMEMQNLSILTPQSSWFYMFCVEYTVHIHIDTVWLYYIYNIIYLHLQYLHYIT